MAATRKDILGWIKRGQDNGQDFLIVVCDTFEYDDYPVFVKGDNAVCQKEYDIRNGKEMQKVMEVYDLHGDIEDQISRTRAFPPWLTR